MRSARPTRLSAKIVLVWYNSIIRKVSNGSPNFKHSTSLARGMPKRYPDGRCQCLERLMEGLSIDMKRFNPGDLVTINWGKFIAIDGLDKDSLGVVLDCTIHEWMTVEDPLVTVLWTDGHIEAFMAQGLTLWETKA